MLNLIAYALPKYNFMSVTAVQAAWKAGVQFCVGAEGFKQFGSKVDRMLAQKSHVKNVRIYFGPKLEQSLVVCV